MTFNGKEYDYAIIYFKNNNESIPKRRDSTIYKGKSWTADMDGRIVSFQNDSHLDVYNIDVIAEVAFGFDNQ